jgi:hypothetical protein
MRKKIGIVLMVLLLACGLAWAKDYQVTKKAGDYTVDVRMDKNPPVTGKNNVTIEIKDKTGKTVKDAKVTADYGMPAMPGMPAMNYKADTILRGSVYHAVLNLSMAGPWNVAVKIVRAGQSVGTRFSIDVR